MDTDDLAGEAYGPEPEETDETDDVGAEAGEQLVSADGDAGAAAACSLLPVRSIERVSAAFKTKVCAIAQRLGADPNHLMAMMSHESGFDPSVYNKQGSGAVGLLQFMPDTVKPWGVTPEELSRMTAEDQLDYVERYFRPYKGRLKTLEDVYCAGLKPTAIGQPSETVLYERPDKRYEQNKVLDVDRDGRITKAEAASGVTRILEAAQQKAAAATAHAFRPGGPVRPLSAASSPAFEDAPDIWRPRSRPGHRTVRPLAGTPSAPTETTSAPAGEEFAFSGRYAEYSDVLAPEPDLPAEALRARVLAAPQPLGAADRLRIIDVVARLESGGQGYAAVNADGEFNDPGLPQYQKSHVGLSWGFVQFSQAHGPLGLALQACERRDPGAFAEVFGEAGGELLRVTNAATPSERLAPVAGVRLWEEPWLQRFRTAGGVPAFQAAQREVADQHSLIPNVAWAGELGLATDRGLAFVFDRCVHMGNGTGPRWVVGTAGPIRSQKQRDAALAALGHPDLAAFQASAGLEPSGWSALTHAALVGALRRLGAASPVAVPPVEAMLDALVTAARDRAKSADKTWTAIAHRLGTLRTTTDLSDVPYEVA